MLLVPSLDMKNLMRELPITGKSKRRVKGGNFTFACPLGSATDTQGGEGAVRRETLIFSYNLAPDCSLQQTLDFFNKHAHLPPFLNVCVLHDWIEMYLGVVYRRRTPTYDLPARLVSFIH